MQGKTIDAFHNGRFHVVQPAMRGHRSGLDAILLAAAVPGGFSGVVADFGAGAGAVGFAVAARCAGATIVLVERSAEMAGYARESIALKANAGLAGRISVVVADVASAGRARSMAGLDDRSADFILMNPPFNDARGRSSDDALRRDAHVAGADLFESWIRSAAAIARPGARLALIARPRSIVDILKAMKGRFGGAEIVPVHPTTGKAAIRIVVRAAQRSRGDTKFLPPLILHEEDRQPSDRVRTIGAGEAPLFGD